MERDAGITLTKLLQDNAKMCILPSFRCRESLADFVYRDPVNLIFRTASTIVIFSKCPTLSNFSKISKTAPTIFVFETLTTHAS